MKLYTYYRSSSSFRVRIALNFKGLAYDPVFVHLFKGEQGGQEHLARNPQGLIPVLEDGDVVLSQSGAIIEYLEETHPEPALLPNAAKDRAQVRRMVSMVACDIQPLDNLKVLKYLKDPMGHSQKDVNTWYCHWITLNFRALEALVADMGKGFCFGDQVTMADVFLFPQIWNARRFDCDLAEFKHLAAIEKRLAGIKAFADALPENQPDAE